ncbi:MAG TPA: histidine kinase dimerization/phospho-acceptor domain-containing protein, partial [Thermoanaerobaculia bacterium]|nr:histidine kinase dimerization/phospho-acceptor domain-containing protein [Thermoanaerobaculia bacterium]
MSAAPRALRRDAPLLLAGALLVFVALAGFTLLTYRDAVRRLSAERETEAAALADRLAREAARLGTARVEPLAPLLPAGAALALYDSTGRPLASLGYADPPPPTVAGVALGHLGGATSFGPGATGLPTVVGLAPYAAGSERRYLRVDLPAAVLAGRLRGLAWLTPLVLLLSLAAAALLIVYVRALSRPYEEMLERARRAGAPLAEGRDELAALVATFDRALEALSARPAAIDRLREALGGELDGGFLLLGPEGDVLAATPAASELLGIAPPTPGTPLREALGERAELAGLLAAAVASGEPLPRGAVDVEREGAPGKLGVTAEPLRSGEGRPRAWLVVVADHTELERRAAQERLADGLAQLGELSAGVAHELRNSLAALSGWVALAHREPLPAGAEECLAEIARESARLTRVVEDFLAFARPGTRRLET